MDIFIVIAGIIGCIIVSASAVRRFVNPETGRRRRIIISARNIRKETEELLVSDLNALEPAAEKTETKGQTEIAGIYEKDKIRYKILILKEKGIIRIDISRENRIPGDIIIRKDGKSGNSVPGDRGLSGFFLSSSPEQRMTALLCEEARDCIKYLGRNYTDVNLENGQLALETSFTRYVKKGLLIRNTVEKAGILFRLLSDDADTRTLLERNIRNDPQPAVVVQNLKKYSEFCLRGKKPPEFIRELAYHENRNISLEAVRILGSDGKSILEEILADCSKRYNTIQRRNSLDSLVKLEGRKCIPFLVKVYLSEECPRRMRPYILFSLEELNARVPAEGIARAMKEGTNQEKQTALNMAAAMCMHEVLPLIHALADDKNADYFLRSRAANAAGSIIRRLENDDSGMLSLNSENAEGSEGELSRSGDKED